MATNVFDAYLIKSIESVLGQSFEEFELIVVVNGANGVEVEESIRRTFPGEPRLVLLRCRMPQLAYALNFGIENARFDYVARMDADDVSHPERLGRQLDFMLRNQLDMAGCDVDIIDENDTILRVRRVPKGAAINRALFFENPFVHPSVMIRKEVVFRARGYNAGFNSEDYDLWLRLRRQGVRWDNMDDVLLSYRVHLGSTQRRILGYAEVAGLMVREFILHKTLLGFVSIMHSFAKSVFRAERK